MSPPKSESLPTRSRYSEPSLIRNVMVAITEIFFITISRVLRFGVNSYRSKHFFDSLDDARDVFFSHIYISGQSFPIRRKVGTCNFKRDRKFCSFVNYSTVTFKITNDSLMLSVGANANNFPVFVACREYFFRLLNIPSCNHQQHKYLS